MRVKQNTPPTENRNDVGQVFHHRSLTSTATHRRRSSFVQIFALDTMVPPSINRGQKVQLFSFKHIRMASLSNRNLIKSFHHRQRFSRKIIQEIPLEENFAVFKFSVLSSGNDAREMHKSVIN